MHPPQPDSPRHEAKGLNVMPAGAKILTARSQDNLGGGIMSIEKDTGEAVLECVESFGRGGFPTLPAADARRMAACLPV